LKNVLRLYIENFIDEELDIIILEHKGIFINKLANNVISKILEVRDNTIYYTVNHDFVCNCIDEDVCSMENFLDSEDEGVDVEEKTEE
jgi:alpha-D-ribose 1-methylphosphonate 5-triphosphate synthase subunit PhnL